MRAPVASLLLLAASAAPARGNWYDGLVGVKVLTPEHAPQSLVNALFDRQSRGQFDQHRYAVLLTPGVYPEHLHIPVSYYTSIIGVGSNPEQVSVSSVYSVNGGEGGATCNFWRSLEGVTVRTPEAVWAVSQASPIRRSVFDHELHLSDKHGYSSGGFIADVRVKGTLDLGTQQQWFTRNSDLDGGVSCPGGWNYVFTGVSGASPETMRKCGAALPGKVTTLDHTPRVAEKPYLVMELSTVWRIYVPSFASNPSRGATPCYDCNIARRLDLDNDVFIARPGHTHADINAGIAGKQGLLVTPGVYRLAAPIKIVADHFVVLGIGFPTLIATEGLPAVQVADGLSDVRVAGLLLQAGTPMRAQPTRPLLQWGLTAAKAWQRLPPGVLSDVFARVGAFKHEGCQAVRSDTMIEINSNDVVIDNVWAWHADHDDCGTKLGHFGKSDECFTRHGVVVNGNRVTAYGMSAEHTVAGDIVRWNGEEGETYFYQCELPYNNRHFGPAGFMGYAVAPGVLKHTAHGLGVYVIGRTVRTDALFSLPAYAEATHLMGVVIAGQNDQIQNIACKSPGGRCFMPTTCSWGGMRCILVDFPRSAPPEPAGDPLHLQAASRVLAAAVLLLLLWVPCAVYWSKPLRARISGLWGSLPAAIRSIHPAKLALVASDAGE